MVDTDWIDNYSIDGFVQQIMDLFYWLKISSKPIIVGHSLQGCLGLHVAHRMKKDIEAFIMIDSSISPPTAMKMFERNYSKVSKNIRKNINKSGVCQYYETNKELKKRFRLIPQQPVAYKYIVEFIKTHSIRNFFFGLIG